MELFYRKTGNHAIRSNFSKMHRVEWGIMVHQKQRPVHALPRHHRQIAHFCVVDSQICYAIIEDTLLFVMFGDSRWVIVVARSFVAIIVTWIAWIWVSKKVGRERTDG